MSEQLDSRALWSVSYGLYVVASCAAEETGGQICNTVIQTSAEPPKVLVALNKQNHTHGLVFASGVFTVSVLSEDTPLPFIAGFGFRSGRDVDKFEGVEAEKGETGCPVVLENAVSVFEARVYETADAGTHTIFLADVVAGRVVSDGGPMTYAQYHAMKGRAPKAAPTYRGKEEDASSGRAEEGVKGEKMKRYVCGVCGYVYDPADGDPDNGVEPGTAFEDLPDDWVCPVCGAEKSEFSPE